MDREITVNLTPKLIRSVVIRRSGVSLFIVLLIPLLVGISTYLQSSNEVHDNWESLLTSYLPPLLVLFFFCWFLFNNNRKNMEQIKKMGMSEIRYRITDDAFRVQTEKSSAQHTWDVFKLLQKGPKAWLLVTHQGTSMVLPTELLDEELREFLSSKVTSKAERGQAGIFKIVAFWLLMVVIALYFFNQHKQPKPAQAPEISGESSR